MIRPALVPDARDWVALAVSMREYYPGLDPDSHARAVEKCAASGEALVAQLDGRLAGGLLFSRKRRELSFLMVAPWARRHGLGRALAQSMLANFPGGETISVTTYRAGDPSGDAARPFYESLGFVPGAEVVSHGSPAQVFTLFVPIETPRLLLRPFRDADFEPFLTLLDMPELPGWGMQKPRARAFFAAQIASAQKMDIINGGVCLGLFEKSTHSLVGFAGAGRHDDLGEPEIFYAILPAYRGKGYATEACRAATKWALARFGLSHIIGTADVDNRPSRRILENCGYELVDERTLTVHVTGGQFPFACYRRLAPEIRVLGDEYRGYEVACVVETDRVYEVCAHEAGFTLTENALPAPRRFDYRATLLEDWLESPLLLGAFIAGAPAGYAEGFLEAWNNRYRITNLFVEPSFRGRGVGEALLREMIRRAGESGARAVALETQSFNVPAISLYRRCGFRFIGLDTTAYSNEDIARGNVRVEMGRPL